MALIKNLYANGDSFVFGMEAIGDNSRDLLNKEFSFVKHIADNFNLSYTNNAYNAATNEFIFRRTIFDLEKLEKTINPKETFVVVGWTALCREEIVAKNMFNYFLGSNDTVSVDPNDLEYHNFGTFFINPGQSQDVVLTKNNYRKSFNISQQATEFCTMYFWDEQYQQQKLEAQILGLHGYLSQKGYPHIFVNCCAAIDNSFLIDTKSTFLFNFKESFYKWGSTNYPKYQREKNHFDSTVHKEYAKLLVNYINQEKILG
jgi:hypothetical protein